MAAQSPIARFFVPAQKAGKERAEPAALASSLANSPPQTPGPRAPSLKDDALSTPPSIESRKRPLKDSGSEPKKMKAGSPNKDAVVRDEDITEGGPPSFATPQRAQEGPKDLRATLQLAERSAPGSIPPFTAECFHHFENGGSQYSWPAWLRPENLRDAQGLRPTEPGYNQGTLWVPDPVREKAEYQKAQGHNTPMLMQYWKLKSKHFDKVAFFKVGKFYEIFYYDAFIAQRICNLKWMGQEKKPHVGFPEMAKHEYARRVVEAGFKVVVVEQVERVVETNQRKTEGQTTGPTCVERDVCEVYTNGTLVDPELLAGPGSRFLAYLFFEGQRGLDFAACLVDCATSQIQLGHFNDAPDRNRLRTMLAQLQPSEIVYDTANLPIEVMQLLKRLPCRPQLSSRSAGDCGLLKAREMMNKYRAAHPKAFNPAVQEVLTQDSAVIAAAGIMDYLEAALLAERLLPFATWDVLATAAKTRTNSQRMILDATALSALEVVETLEGGYEGSLLAFLDHTSTPFGFRLLKQWVCAPLLDLEDIQSRQEAVEYFLQNDELSKQLRASLKKCIAGGKISKLPVDLERATSRIWSYALQAERKAVMYDDITARRLGHFVELMEAYEQCYQLLSTAFPAQGSLPGRLAMVAKPQKAGGILPELMPIISKLRGSVVEATGKNGALKFRPQDGADPVYDQKSREIHMVKSQLDKELQRVKATYPKVQFCFVHRLPGYRYEVECDEHSMSAAAQRSLDITGRVKGKVRFHTPQIKELLVQLDQLEDEQEDCIFPFLSKLFREFHLHQAPFRALVRCVSEVDALLSLAAASKGLPGAACRPEFLASDARSAASIELRTCRHPVVAARMGSAFVPNDTALNACGVPGLLIVTGPNMGGKSTVLRQTCIAVLMAQVGCRVNAQKCRLTPVDRIFTRIGAYDAVLEGKSTLLTELEETAALLAHGTPRSLAVLDELGRGTSTFDGAAIASAVLEELKCHVRCPVLFATHYHPVSKKAAEDTANVAPFHMAAAVNQGTHEMTFLYKFLPGLCPSSHGHNVAKIAGLPDKVLMEARARSAEFDGAEVSSEEVERLVQLAAQGDVSALKELFRQRHKPSQCP
ncbi:MSH6 [Symbiodinium necroappetens]|uniref:DNA mismatch repair protein n=1 Tax=Symbiodinium necroappetens TaxID=1628268 RepID=A0A813A7Z9_9DINO|nr:MSH6 [Symbiodinium necroappetens]